MKSQLKLSLSDFSFHRFGVFSRRLDRVLSFARSAGFDGLELNETLRSKIGGPARLRAMAERAGVPIVSVHHSLSRMVYSSLGSIRRLLERADALGARTAVVHIAAARHHFSHRHFFARVRELEQRYKIPVGFENAMAQFRHLKVHGMQYSHEPDLFRDGIVANELAMTYDIGHMASLQPDPSTYYDQVQKHLINIHLQDYRRGIDHLPLGQGELPLVPFLKKLVNTNYRGLVTLEVFPLNLRPFASAAYVERTLRESLAFFRKHTDSI